MYRTLLASFAALALMSGAASAAYAEGNNLAEVEVPATAPFVSAGPAMSDSGSEAYPTFADVTMEESRTASRDTGSDRTPDFNGVRSHFGETRFAHNGNNARS